MAETRRPASRTSCDSSSRPAPQWGRASSSRLGDEAAISDALDRTHGADVIAALSAGLQSQLAKRSGHGAELSGGQWQ